MTHRTRPSLHVLLALAVGLDVLGQAVGLVGRGSVEFLVVLAVTFAVGVVAARLAPPPAAGAVPGLSARARGVATG